MEEPKNVDVARAQVYVSIKQCEYERRCNQPVEGIMQQSKKDSRRENNGSVRKSLNFQIFQIPGDQRHEEELLDRTPHRVQDQDWNNVPREVNSAAIVADNKKYCHGDHPKWQHNPECRADIIQAESPVLNDSWNRVAPNKDIDCPAKNGDNK